MSALACQLIDTGCDSVYNVVNSQRMKGADAMKRVVFHATEEMWQALSTESNRRNSPIAAIVREALEQYFGQRGVELKQRVEWGKPTEDESPGQPEAALAG